MNVNASSGSQYVAGQHGSFNTQNNYYAVSKASSHGKRREALFHSDPLIDRTNLLEEKGGITAGTCVWMKEHAAYLSWLHGNNKTLWICGGPGKGKTMLSIYLTMELEQHSRVIFYFFSHKTGGRNTATVALRGLIWQLLRRYPDLESLLEEYLDPVLQSSRNDSTLASKGTLWRLTLELLERLPNATEPIYCVLDGLDECNDADASWLVKKITTREGLQVPPPNLRLAVVSRPSSKLGLRSCIKIQLDPDNDNKVHTDIRRMISDKMSDLGSRGIAGFDGETREMVKRKLLERAQGTFLWVGFAVHELLKCTTTTELLEQNEIVPSGLDSMYAHIVDNINPKHRNTVARVIRWVALAERSLRISEIRGLVAPSEKATDPISQTTSDVIRACKPMIIDQKEHLMLVHQSARDWLLLKDRRTDCPDDESDQFRFHAKKVHLEMADLCLHHLSSKGPLAGYAKEHWATHARGAPEQGRWLFEHHVEIFGEPSEKSKECWRNMLPWKDTRAINHVAHPVQLPLHLACQQNLSTWAWLITTENWWKFDSRRLYSVRDCFGCTALWHASSTGLHDLISILILNGAEVDARDREGSTPLMAAIDGPRDKSIETMQILLREGADINIRDNKRETALHRAVSSGHEEAVLLLLKHDHKRYSLYDELRVLREFLGYFAFFPSTKSWWAHTPYGPRFPPRGLSNREDSEFGVHKRCDLEVDASNSHKQTALHMAARLGDQTVARRLLDGGANIEAHDYAGDTPLHVAVQVDREDMVQLLLEKGASASAANIEKQTPLHLAVGRGRVKILSALISGTKTINACDNRGRTALHYLAEQALERSMGESWGLAQWERNDVSMNGRHAVTLVTGLFLRHRAKFALKDSEGETALEIAERKGNGGMLDGIADFRRHIQSNIEDSGNPGQAGDQKN